jgi:hypothetical protein
MLVFEVAELKFAVESADHVARDGNVFVPIAQHPRAAGNE